MTIGALILCLRSASVSADPLSDALGAYAKFDYATAFPLFEKLANEKNPEARFYLGVMTMLGQGVSKDPAKGLTLLRSAANADVVAAQSFMGRIYENGYGVTADPVEALTWYKIANSHASPSTDGPGLYAEARAGLLEKILPKEQVEQATDRAGEWKISPPSDLDEP